MNLHYVLKKPHPVFSGLISLTSRLHTHLSGAYAGFHDGKRVHGNTLKTDLSIGHKVTCAIKSPYLFIF